MAIHEDLLSLLADGCVHSGSELATKLGVTRAAVWKNIAQLKEFGLPVSAMAGKGYQLGAPVELLDRQAIEQHLTADIRAGCSSLDVM